MKKLCVLIIIIISVFPTTVHAQESWFWQYPKPQGNTLRDIFIFDQNTAISVGDLGTVIKTTDGGETWNVQHHVGGTSNSLNSVWFIDNYIGWMIDNHVVFKTTDGGDIWFEIYDGTECIPSHVHFIDENTGFVFGKTTEEGWGYGVCCKTMNGGKDWTCSRLPGRMALYRYSASFFMNFDTGWVVGDAFGPNVIYKTTDCGKTWVQKQVEPLVYGLQDIYFIDDKNGFIVGLFGAFLKTNDGGNTWHYQNLWEKYQKVEYQNFNSVFFTDSLNGWIVGPGFILETADGGEDWAEVENSEIIYNLFKVRFSGKNTGWIVGGDGEIYRTTDGGNNWISQREEKYTFSSIYFLEEDTGWAVGENGVIFHTTNGGENWIRQNVSEDLELSSVYALDDQNVFAVGAVVKGSWPAYSRNGVILRTINGGQSWERQVYDTLGIFSSIIFVNNATGWITAGNGILLKTIDSGYNWDLIDSGVSCTLKKIQFINETTGWIDGRLKTTDGGVNWVIQSNLASKNSFYFINADKGWLIGDNSKIFSTIDGGETWDPCSIPYKAHFFSVHFVDTANGWIAGFDYLNRRSIILKTNDGGETWIEQNGPNTGGLRNLFFINENTGWVVGDGIFKTTTGGFVSVDDHGESSNNAPGEIILFQNYPNPFNPSTTIHYQLSKAGFVSLKIYDLLGREVSTLVDKWQPEGDYKVDWDANGLHSSVYFCRLKVEEFIVTRKLIFVK